MKEKRKDKRYMAKNILVTAFSTSENYFNVIDISEGGIAFRIHNSLEINKYLDICTSLSDICFGTKIINITSITINRGLKEYLYRVGCKFQPWVSSKRITQLIEGFEADEGFQIYNPCAG